MPHRSSRLPVALPPSTGAGATPCPDATWPQSWIQRENWEFETHTLEKPLESRFNKRYFEYFEAQVHKGVTLDDIEEIIFCDTPDYPPPVEELTRLGIAWRTVACAF